MKCRACGASVAAEDTFCGECGTALERGGLRSQAPPVPALTARMCPHCSSEVPADTTICLSCGYELDDVATGFDPGPAVAAADGRTLIPGSPIVLGEGERVWRRYNVMGWPELRVFGITISRVKGGGTLYITDSRVLFYASLAKRRGRASALIQETQLQHITGLMAYVSRSWSWRGFLVAFFVALIGVGAISLHHIFSGIVVLAVAAFGFALLLGGLALRGTVGVVIQSSATQTSPIGFGLLGDPNAGTGFWRRMIGPFSSVITLIWGPRDAADLLMAMPGPDAERVILELGALVSDMQAKGNLVQTHWGVESAVPSGGAARDNG